MKQTFEATTVVIHSTPFIYSPGFFKWLEQGRKDGTLPDQKFNKFLDGLGVPREFWKLIKQGKYATRTEGEELHLEFNQ